jgi:drug/metabolite transporter (DMT)-like permease
MKIAHVKYLLALLLFGSNGIVASYIFLSSYEIVWFRTLIGSLFLILIFAFSGQSLRIGKNKRELGCLIVSGAMGASWMFLYEAYARIGVGTASLAYYCGPVLVMALTPLLFHEAISGAKLLGFLSVAGGMVLVNRQELLQGEFSWGLLCGILAAVTYAIMVIFNKKATRITGLANSVCQLSVSFLTVSLFLLMK